MGEFIIKPAVQEAAVVVAQNQNQNQNLTKSKSRLPVGIFCGCT